MTGTPLGVLLALSLAAPPPDRPAPPPDRQFSLESERLAHEVIAFAKQVSARYVRETPVGDLLLGSAEALYQHAGRDLPAELRKQLKDASADDDYLRALTEALVALGRPDGMSRTLAYVVMVNGFGRVTDPNNVLTWQSPARTSAASGDSDFGVGFELDGATGAKWIAYLIDARDATGRGLPDPPRPPIGPRWEVRRVFPGSPAATAGLRPRDVITHVGDEPVTAATNADLFRRMVGTVFPDLREPRTTVDASKPIALRVRRPGKAELLDLAVPRTVGYTPESVFGVVRRADGTWDHIFDKEARIGYIRLGPVENPAAEAFPRAVADVVRYGATGLILDLRWCPGGWVDPTHHICATLLPEGLTIATVKYRDPARDGQGQYSTGPGLGRPAVTDLPVVVLVGPHTTGGGEMIAAALQDHGRAVIMGQRTFGRGNVMHTMNPQTYSTQSGGSGLVYRISTGTSYRPNGKLRHRFPDAKPTDDWGVRPDKGYEVPMTPDLSAKLRMEAELQAIRPAGDWRRVPFDDPLEDPQKLLAVKWLKEKNGNK